MDKISFKIIIRDFIILLLILGVLYYLFFFNRAFLQKVLDFMFYSGLLYMFYSAIGKYIYRIPFSEWRNSDRIVFIIALSCFLFASGAMLEQKSQKHFAEITEQKSTTENTAQNSINHELDYGTSTSSNAIIPEMDFTDMIEAEREEHEKYLNGEYDNSTYVYIIENGNCYHRLPSCNGLKNPEKITISDAKIRGYNPCAICQP